MAGWIRKVWFLLLAYLPTKPKEAPKPKQKSRKKVINDLDGKWYFRKDILDKLDGYFRYIKLMKKADPDSYRFYVKLGASLSAATAGEAPKHLPGRWADRENRPGFGALALLFKDGVENNEDKTQFWGMKFCTFRKMDIPPPDVQVLADVDIYSYCGIFELKPDQPTAMQFFVGVDAAGNITQLRQLGARYQHLKGKSYGHVIQHTAWKMPHIPIGSADMVAHQDGLAGLLFRAVAHEYENANSGLRVSAKRGNKHAVFNIDMLRTPYFFKDREFVPAVDGKRKRIFHIVRVHKRMTNGKEVYVKTHFRGARHFNWNGYRIAVSMPGYHHGDMLEFTGGALDADDLEPYDRNMLTTGQAGKKLLDHIESNKLEEVWKSRRKGGKPRGAVSTH